MSAFPDDPDHFRRWLSHAEGGHSPFVRRRLYGLYLQELLTSAAADPARLRLISGEAVDLIGRGDGYDVTLADGGTFRATTVVLATGNLPPTLPGGLRDAGLDSARLVADPWREDAIEGLAADDTLLIVGTGLTAVDVVVDAVDRGFAGRIVAMSRRGQWPRSHERAQPPVEPLTTVPAGPLSTLLHQVRARAAAIGWRGAIDALRPVTQTLWARADPTTRARFLRHLRPYWDVHRHRLAPEVAERLDALRAGGRLESIAGRLIAARPVARGVAVDWRAPGSDAVETLHVDRIVNCSGVGADLSRTREPLMRQAIARGLVSADRLGLGIRVNPDCQVIAPDGDTRADLLCIGPMTRGAFWEVTAVPDLRRQAWTVARRLANAHWVQGEGL